MLNELNIYTGVRYATTEEINTYEWVKTFLQDFNDDDFMKIIEATSEYACDGGRKNYQKVYRLIRKYGLDRLTITVSDLVTWYFID